MTSITSPKKQTPNIFKVFLIMTCLSTLAVNAADTLAVNAADTLSPYNIIWDTPSADHHGSMPLGNGDVGLNLWMEPDGDLCFYIGKTDSWGDNGRLLKLGKVRVQLSPNPLTPGASFKQTLNLKNGEVLIDIGGENPTRLKIWVDANNPLIHVESKSKTPVKATASIELWRKKPEVLPSVEVGDHLSRHPKPVPQTIVEADTILEDLNESIGWYHLNKKSKGPAFGLKYQGLDDFSEFTDPLLHRIFGAVITAEGATPTTNSVLTTKADTAQSIRIAVHTCAPSTVEEWLTTCKKTLSTHSNVVSDYSAHVKWWSTFWDRSYICMTGNEQAQTRFVAANEHLIRIGSSQTGGQKFAGEFGRVSLCATVLSDAAVSQLYDGGREKEPNLPDVLYSGTPLAGKAVPNSNAWNGENGLTLEAWIKPGKLPASGSRIIDKITAGGSNGFLLDTYPGNSLRLITEGGSLIKKACLPANKWSHIAATINSSSGDLKLFVNGRIVARKNDAFIVSRGYTLQRFIDACGGRGRYPIKFNGSIFTVPHKGKPGGPDYRRWGSSFWWQNTRLPYISMCMAGDYEFMHSLFRMYAEDFLPLVIHRTKKYFNHGGAFFSEIHTPWGTVADCVYGWGKSYKDRKDPLQTHKLHKWEWVAGPELIWMMLDYYDYSGNEQFLKDTLLPTAMAVITFFDEHYKTNADGELVMHPAMACETWLDCTNPMPELAGLYGITERLMALPDSLTTAENRKFWKTFHGKLAPLPVRDTESGKALAPGTIFKKKANIENPELYAVFPFRRIAIGKPNIEWGKNALIHRWNKGASGWYQSSLFMAYLGLAEQAKTNLVKRASKFDGSQRFPAFWGPNYDWTPDQDHGGILTAGVQAMLMQVDPYSDKIYLLPALPKSWNADFKLHAPKGTVIECSVKDGSIKTLKVTPESRRKDIILSQ